MALTLYKTFTAEQREKLGPAKRAEVLSTERHVYHTPFLYENVEVGDFYEVGSAKGIEFKADTGFITIREEQPIIAVTVVGSGCTPGGYNICEWWGEGESVDNIQDQLVKRQRVDNLNGTHPSIWTRILMGVAGDRAFSDVAPEMKDAFDCFKKLSDGFYGGVYLGFYENTAYFRIGPPNPHSVTIRSGCKVTEDPGTSLEHHPGDYTIRLVETIVVKG
jgi:hypothetical protein